MYEGRLYVDTPGLYQVDPLLTQQAAQEIEKALKKGSNCKIIFVIEPSTYFFYAAAHLATIEVICSAIKTDFKYGIIFNKGSKRTMQLIDQAGGLNKDWGCPR